MTADVRPLAGKRVVVTRPRRDAAALVERLASLGAEVIEAPAIEIAPPVDPAPLDLALRSLASFDWMAFTSAHAVEAVRRRMEGLGIGSLPAAVKVASIGEATSDAVAVAFGRPADLEPVADFRARGLLRALAGVDPIGRVLLPVSDRARTELQDGLRAGGADVTTVVAYATVPSAALAGRLTEALAGGGLDLVLLASPSAVESLGAALGPRALRLATVAIGPTTEKAAEEAGLRVLAVAASPGVDGLVEATLRALGPAPSPAPPRSGVGEPSP
jgi:uroporphyrinogen III methyltransferase/synthase